MVMKLQSCCANGDIDLQLLFLCSSLVITSGNGNRRRQSSFGSRPKSRLYNVEAETWWGDREFRPELN
jgi:hypothetical protein